MFIPLASERFLEEELENEFIVMFKEKMGREVNDDVNKKAVKKQRNVKENMKAEDAKVASNLNK